MRWIIIAFLALTTSLHAQGVMPWAFVNAPVAAAPSWTPEAWKDTLLALYVSKDAVDSLGRSNGDTVGTLSNRAKWLSSANVSANLFAITAPEKPTVVVSGGTTCLRFDGVDDRMFTALGSATAIPITIFAVARLKGVQSGDNIIVDGVTSANRLIIYTKSTAQNLWMYGGSTETNSGIALNYDSIYVFRGVFNGAASYGAVNTSIGATVNPGSDSFTGITVGERQNNALANGEIDMFELVYITGVPTSYQISRYHEYVKNAYGVNLP